MQRALERRSSPASVLPIQGTGLQWARGGRGIVAGVDIAIDGHCGPTILLGPNGAGKSVLLRILAGLVAPDAGSVTWGGMPPSRERAHTIGFVFQKPVLLRRSVLANIEYALAVAGVARDERRDRARASLAGAGLSHLEASPARVLSGGEQQRVALARALAVGPEILILDEPTSNLDPASVAAIEGQLRAAHGSGLEIMMVTQDLGQARRLAGEVVFMHKGQLRERTPAAEFFRAPSTPEARAFMAGEIVL